MMTSPRARTRTGSLVSDVHIYRAAHQPAHRYRVSLGETGFWVRCKPRALRLCFKCNKYHYAKNMVVQVYYDGVYVWCKPGKGCKAR